MKNQYRIVTDGWLGFEVQVKRWWFPVWVQCHKYSGTNTHKSVSGARSFALEHSRKGTNVVEVIK